jgi:hypothetical protein
MVQFSPNAQIPDVDASFIENTKIHLTNNDFQANALFNAASAFPPSAAAGDLSMFDTASFNTDEFMRTTNMVLGKSTGAQYHAPIDKPLAGVATATTHDDDLMHDIGTTKETSDQLETLHLTPFRPENIDDLNKV